MSSSDTVPNPFMSSRYYDRMKFFTLVVLPAFGALYFGLGNATGLPAVEAVVGSVTVVGTFLGAVLGLSSSQFKAIAQKQAEVDEQLEVQAEETAKQEAEAKVAGYIGSNGSDPDTGLPNITLVVTKDPNEILASDEVVMKVGQAPRPAAPQA